MIDWKNDSGWIALLFSVLTFLLFTSSPYLLDLIAPSKSIGQIIGETTRDVIGGLNGEKPIGNFSSKRDLWFRVLNIISYITLAIGCIFSIKSISDGGAARWKGIASAVLLLIGVGVYLSFLSISLIVSLVVLVIVALLVIILAG